MKYMKFNGLLFMDLLRGIFTY